jgi:hypothetical protein
MHLILHLLYSANLQRCLLPELALRHLVMVEQYDFRIYPQKNASANILC